MSLASHLTRRGRNWMFGKQLKAIGVPLALAAALAGCSVAGPKSATPALDASAADPTTQCLGQHQWVTRYSPIELYLSATQCIQQNKLDEAVFLYGAAGSEGRFDRRRVTDETAHQVANFLGLIFQKELGDEVSSRFLGHMRTQLDDAAAREVFCGTLKKQPPPSYQPTYMVGHGMRALTSSTPEAAVKALPDAQAAWEASVNDYMDCGQ